jgi:hypothetical protein
MKKLFFISMVLFGLSSCYKEDVNPPNPPQPIVTNNTPIDSAYTLAGETWVITGYRVGEIGNQIPTSDTLVFLTQNQYSYNGVISPYSFYPTASAFNLTLNFTPYGNISGSIYQGNLNLGVISGLKFTDITMGSGNGTNYYLWMTRQ